MIGTRKLIIIHNHHKEYLFTDAWLIIFLQASSGEDPLPCMQIPATTLITSTESQESILFLFIDQYIYRERRDLVIQYCLVLGVDQSEGRAGN
jgi:hypothetical protein